jgi:hypothetical protein
VAFSKLSVFDGRNRAIAPFGWRDGSPDTADRDYRDQPRVPKGNPDGGQWTRESFGARFPSIQLAAKGGPPRFGGLGQLALLAWNLYELIRDYRRNNLPADLFGPKTDPDNSVVTVTMVDGRPVFGVNSTYHTRTSVDDAAANRKRTILVTKYPEIFKSENIGQRPNNALFHAEADVLIKAARLNGGTLEGRSLHVVIDGRVMCNDCIKALPKLGLELGNPRVTFIDTRGVVRTMHNGEWE